MCGLMRICKCIFSCYFTGFPVEQVSMVTNSNNNEEACMVEVVMNKNKDGVKHFESE